MNGNPNYIDPAKWNPMIMNFCEYFGLSEQLSASKLAPVFGPDPVFIADHDGEDHGKAKRFTCGAYGQYKLNLSFKPSTTCSGISLILISPPRKSSQFVISVNSSILFTSIKALRTAVVW